MAEKGDKTLKELIEKAKAEKDLKEIVDTINKGDTYKVLSKEEYDHLVNLASKTPSSTPKPAVESGGAKPKTTHPPPPPLTGYSPVPRFTFNKSVLQNTSSLPSGPYVPKLPIFSGSEGPSKGEASYEVWNFEVKCLKNNEYLSEHLLLQAIRSSLRGSAREMLIPLGESATVDEILQKLDGFYDDPSTTQTLMQSFYSDCQKEEESIVAFGSRLEHTLSRAIASGHIDSKAKDSMLCSKFWTGLKSQALKNSTRYLYSNVSDFQTLLKEIRKIDMENASAKTSGTKKQSAHQLSGNVTTEDTNTQLLKQMTELMGCMKKMTESIEKQSKAVAEMKESRSYQEHYDYGNKGNYGYRGRFRGNKGGNYRGGYGRGRGYQNDNSNKDQNKDTSNNKRGNGYGRSRGGYRGGANGRGANRGNSSGGQDPLN